MVFLTFMHEISQLRSSTCQKTRFSQKFQNQPLKYCARNMLNLKLYCSLDNECYPSPNHSALGEMSQNILDNFGSRNCHFLTQAKVMYPKYYKNPNEYFCSFGADWAVLAVLSTLSHMTHRGLTSPHSTSNSRFGHYFCSNLYGRAPMGPLGVKKSEFLFYTQNC